MEQEIQQSTSTENPTNPTLAMVMPAYIRERMQRAKQPRAATEQEKPDQPVQAVEAPTQAESSPDEMKTENDANAWKGRLNKEQSAHKDTQAKLLAEAQARIDAEQRLAQQQARLNELEAKLSTPHQAPQTPPISDDDFTDEEIEEMEISIGKGVRKLIDRVRQVNTPTGVDVNKAIDERLSAERERQNALTLDKQWQQAVMEQLPDIQGLMSDPAFITYCQETEIDFMGNSAIHLINETGKARNIANIPKIRAVIDGYKKQHETPTIGEQQTAPPSNKSAAVTPPKVGVKRKMTAKDEVHKRRLMLAGKTDELKAFLAQFR